MSGAPSCVAAGLATVLAEDFESAFPSRFTTGFLSLATCFSSDLAMIIYLVTGVSIG